MLSFWVKIKIRTITRKFQQWFNPLWVLSAVRQQTVIKKLSQLILILYKGVQCKLLLKKLKLYIKLPLTHSPTTSFLISLAKHQLKPRKWMLYIWVLDRTVLVKHIVIISVLWKTMHLKRIIYPVTKKTLFKNY